MPFEHFAHRERIRCAEEILFGVLTAERSKNGAGTIVMRPVARQHRQPVEGARGLAVELERQQRIARFAFDYAARMKRTRITAIH